MTLYNQKLDISDRLPKMMRHVALNSPDIYEELFYYTKDENPEMSTKAQQILLSLPTCPTMKSEDPSIFDFKDNSHFLIYYKLVLIEDSLSS